LETTRLRGSILLSTHLGDGGAVLETPPPPTDEAGFFRYPSMVEDWRNLCAPRDYTSDANKFDARMAQLQYYRKKKTSLTQASGNCPHF